MANLGLLNYRSVSFGSVKCCKKNSQKNCWEFVFGLTMVSAAHYLILQLNYSFLLAVCHVFNSVLSVTYQANLQTVPD